MITIEQEGFITIQGRNKPEDERMYFLVIQKRNHDKIKNLLNKRLSVEMIFKES